MLPSSVVSTKHFRSKVFVNIGAHECSRGPIVSKGQHASRNAIRARGTRSGTSCLSSGNGRQWSETGERNREKGWIIDRKKPRARGEIGHAGTILGEKWSIVARHGNNADRSDTDGVAISRGRSTGEKWPQSRLDS